MQKKLKLTYISVAAFLIGLILIELLFGGWFSTNNQLSNLGILRDVQLEYNISDLYTTKNPVISYSRDSYGLRGISTFDKPEAIDILTVGGTTTDQRYIDDTKTWQEVLEKEFAKNNNPMLISNAGVHGQSTFGHLKNCELWFPNIEKLQPKLILFYVGINDFYKINGDSKFDEIQQKTNQGISERIKTKSVLYCVYQKLKGAEKAQKATVEHQKINFARVRYTKDEILNEKLLAIYDEKNLKAFKKRIQQLKNYAENKNAIPIFITQPTLHFRIRNGVIYGTEDTNYLENKYAYNGVGYLKLLNKLNDAMREVAGTNAIIDVTNEEDWNVMDFYDFYHMTETGTKKLGKKIYQKMQQKGIVK